MKTSSVQNKAIVEKLKVEQLKVHTQIQAINKDFAERNKYLIQKYREKDTVVKQKRRAIEQELMQKQEISKIRKENHAYNMQREIAIKSDYKKQLIEKLKEKAQKADKLKDRVKTATVYGGLNMTVS